MNNPDKKDKILGIVGSVIFHTIIILILFFTKIYYTSSNETGGGILVAYGNMYEVVTENTPSYTPPKVSSSTEEITQNNDEPTIAADEKEDEKRKEEERKAAEEAKRKKEEETISKEVNSLVSGLFSSSASQENSGSKGSPNGNSESGADSGNAGYGIWDLGGRGLAKGESLPRPQYDNSNIEGKLVVEISVSPAGKVISAKTIPALSDPSVASSVYIRNRAESAAKNAVFESIKGTNDQYGTITYFFKIR